MCHACQNILDFMNVQGDAIVTDWLELNLSKGCILFLYNVTNPH